MDDEFELHSWKCTCETCLQNHPERLIYLDDDEPLLCPQCFGAGVILVCCDDMCIGAGKCMHGDGEDICPTCEGEGVV